MDNVRPLLSIVIANYNYGRYIGEAIESVLSQKVGELVELIICDAASTDNSVEIIKKYTDGLPPKVSYEEWMKGRETTNDSRITWWCSEKDLGQSDAFNKGFSHAKGEFVTWLNADDIILPNVLKKFVNAVRKNPSCHWWIGGVIWLDPNMNVISFGRGRKFSDIRYKCGQLNVCGPSSFVRKSMINFVGGVDVRLHYTMDTDLWLRLAGIAQIKYQPFINYAWGLRLHPDAKMSGHNFDSHGRFRKGTAMELAATSIKAKKLLQEAAIIREHFNPQKMNFFKRVISISWLKVLGGLLDTFRYQNKHYTEYFRS